MTESNSAGTVSFCDQDQDPGAGTVSFCDQKSEDDGTVTFCADQEDPPPMEPVDPCLSIDTMVISGPPEPDEDSGYSVVGGKAPYIWSISAGSISDNGAITDLTGTCGSGTVSVTDSCGNSAEMEVRFSDGQWVETSVIPGPCGIISSPISCDGGVVNCGATITGHTKSEPYVRSGNYSPCISGLDCSSCLWTNHIDSIMCAGVEVKKSSASSCGANASVWVLSHTTIYTWSCP